MSEPGQHYMHPLLRVQVEEWRRRAGVDSATPNAPVVDDRRGPSTWSGWLSRWRSRVRRRPPTAFEALVDT